jgi:hypothetical protein
MRTFLTDHWAALVVTTGFLVFAYVFLQPVAALVFAFLVAIGVITMWLMLR